MFYDYTRSNKSVPILFLCGLLVGFANGDATFASEEATKRFEQAVARVMIAYAQHIRAISPEGMMWQDGAFMPLDTYDAQRTEGECIENPQLIDQIMQYTYQPGFSVVGAPVAPEHDPGRVRSEAFFKKMYGGSPEEVERNLEIIDWMPKVFGQGTYRLRVTRVNEVSERVRCISGELEQLVELYPEYGKFLQRPGDTYRWRMIEGTNRLSNHSFGMTLDINEAESQYWQWDLRQAGQPISEATPLTYRNTVPHEIVEIFEKYGFIWGGKWYHYDTMHFEYRPELFCNANAR